MEAEIERLYQIVHNLSAEVDKLKDENVQVNLSLLELENKFESLRRSFVSGLEV
jgi:hypothetical protein